MKSLSAISRLVHPCAARLATADSASHEPVGVIAGIAAAGQPGLPVRGEQPQAGAELLPPRVPHLTALEDDMVDGAFGEAAAHGQAGVPAPTTTAVVWIMRGARAVPVRPARRGPWSGWRRCRRPPSASATGRSVLRDPRGRRRRRWRTGR